MLKLLFFLNFFFLTCLASPCLLKPILVDLEDKPSEKSERASNLSTSASGPLAPQKENYSTENKEATLRTRNNFVADGLRSKEFSGRNADTKAEKSAQSPNNLQKKVKGAKPDGAEEPSNNTSDTIPIEVILKKFKSY